jgi:hypothetical protein
VEAGAEFEQGSDAAIDDYLAGGGRSEASDQAEQGAFAGAIGADDAYGLAIGNGEIDGPESVERVRE